MINQSNVRKRTTPFLNRSDGRWMTMRATYNSNFALSSLSFFRFFSRYRVHPLFEPTTHRRRDRVKKRGQAILFNDSQFPLKRPPFPECLASTFTRPYEKEASSLSLSLSLPRTPSTPPIPSHYRRSLEGTSAHTKPQLPPLDPRPPRRY